MRTMPGEAPGRESAAPAFPVPAFLIDELLPTLKDTELRLALVVLRQTWGRGKQSDWLSHSQLCRRTGRAGAAVSAAVDALVRRGLIEVATEAGEALPDAASRRRARCRLLYRPGPVLPSSAGANVPHGTLGREAWKAKTTESREGIRRLRKPESPGYEGQAASAASAAPRVVAFTPGQRERIEEEKQRIRQRLSLMSAPRS